MPGNNLFIGLLGVLRLAVQGLAKGRTLLLEHLPQDHIQEGDMLRGNAGNAGVHENLPFSFQHAPQRFHRVGT
jgi:hypothetical protein